MDLSGLKWPIIIVVIVVGGWLLTSGGVNWLFNQATKATPGIDAARDVRDEAMLSRLGGYQMMLWKYGKAIECFEAARNRYGEGGKNYWYNTYREVRCYERLGQPEAAVAALTYLIDSGAHEKDARVPEADNLGLTRNKLNETFELGETQ